MSYSPLTRILREIHLAHEEAEARGMPPDETLEERRERRVSRREFLKRAGSAGAFAAVAGVLGRVGGPSAATPRVVVVGAGLAGLRCAQVLATRPRNPIVASVYEAADRLGGRCWTNRGFFADGQLSEHGGEFISSEHNAMQHLAHSLGLSLEVVSGGSLLSAGPDVYWMDGHYYTYNEANADWGLAFHAFKNAVRSAPFPQLYNKYTNAGYALDHLSVPDWIDGNIAGGTSSRFGRLLLEDVISEYGGDPGNQPALNLIYLLAYNPQTQLNPLAGTDEKYHVVGGNDQLVTKLAAQLPSGAIHTGTVLVALKKNPDGSFTCTFQSGASAFDVPADHVVLALPFSTLRRVDLSRAGLSQLKMTAIGQMGMGTNAKLHVQVGTRPWQALGLSGVSTSDPTGFQICWDETVAQPGPMGILVDFPGGAKGASFVGAPFGAAPAGDVTAFLSEIEPVFPGMSAAYNGLAFRDFWAADPWHRGAYSYWALGQETLFAGYEGVQEGKVHFCGEHTSVDFQGYMEGAVTTGERAAAEI
jgi:monoamine oxidase